ncbi:hypothetical protein [Planococcus shenhongbingii]|uniref:Uncharacterized protein n=1 Tax=Planococcus shenhongbingii TaxID=3058398 RepID=A0ABT8N9T4_9BACL|nr:hypothetical protein [Planococcus sp. N017]MDN7244650.1 hypothetical protein [Planococcus sp. N017]
MNGSETVKPHLTISPHFTKGGSFLFSFETSVAIWAIANASHQKTASLMLAIANSKNPVHMKSINSL